MMQNSRNDMDDWQRRATRIDSAIRHAFPVKAFDQECLRLLLTYALTPTNSASARELGFVWNDEELIDFLKMLSNRDWTEIDWKSHWPALPLLPKDVFNYCLPGIMRWIVTDPGFMYEAAVGLVENRLAPPVMEAGQPAFEFSVFTDEQKRVIGDFLGLLHDFTLRNRPELQESAETVSRRLLNKSSP
jgi:hypothetical protein